MKNVLINMNLPLIYKKHHYFRPIENCYIEIHHACILTVLTYHLKLWVTGKSEN